MSDLTQALQQQVQDAIADKTALNIQGSNSKAFYGNPCNAETILTAEHSGILHYEPTELIISARAGTTLNEIESCLQEHNQILGFEPPKFGEAATLGGTVACNLSGPRRPFAGATRDFVLGCKILNGKGQVLTFGGEVMKNVAGYDVSRLMTGALGTLGLLLEVNLKVLPAPEYELTLYKDIDLDIAIDTMARWTQRPFPISAVCHDGNRLYIRLCGHELSVKSASKKIGGELLENSQEFWKKVREHQHAFFDSSKPLWRISMAPAALTPELDGKWFLDWGGAQRWLVSNQDAETIRKAAASVGGHATCYRNCPDHIERFHPQNETLFHIHKQLKAAFDPDNIFNPGKLYREL